MSIRREWKSFDYLLAAAVLALAIFGAVMIFYATNTGSTPRFENLYKSQRLYVITGFILMVGVALVDYHTLTRFYIPIYALCLLLLLVVLLIGADDASGTARWIRIPLPGGNDQSLQPSEFAKVFIILFLSRFIEVKKDSFNHILYLGLTAGLVALPVFLIQQQPSLSASLVVGVTALAILFAGGLYFRTILIGLAVLVPTGLVVYLDMLRKNPLFITKILSKYQWERIETFLNPVVGSDEYRQVQGSLFAIGSGGLNGKGMGNNTYVINGHNDFIFSVIAEQFGFVGCIIVLGLMFFIIFKCIRIAQRAPDLTGKLIAAGVAGMLTFETFINVSVVTSILPNTGMPFPFLSHGGSTMWVHMIAMGLVLNVGLFRTKSMFEPDE